MGIPGLFLEMKMIHHPLCEFFGILILMLQDGFQGADEEEGVDRDITAAFFEVGPMDELVKDPFVVIPGGIVFADNLLQAEVLATVFVHPVQELRLGNLLILEEIHNQPIDVVIPPHDPLHGEEEADAKKKHYTYINHKITSVNNLLRQPD